MGNYEEIQDRRRVDRNNGEKVVYKETSYKIKTSNGLRQGCPLSPLLFLILIANIEEFMKGRGNGGSKIG